MHKRILAIVTLLCAIPLLAYAGTGLQQINTWVQSPGGSLQVDSYAKVTSKNGSQFLSYSSSTANTVTILPAAGYFVNSLIFDGVPQSASSIATILGSGLTVTDGDSVWVSFLRNQLTFTVTSPGGCLVTPSGAQPNVYAGTTYRVFEFIPIKGLAIASITPASGSGVVYTTTALGVPNQKVVVTVSSITTSGITLTATVSGSAAASTLPTVTTNGVTTTMTSAQAGRACDACHIAQGLDPAGTAIFLPFSTSVHKLGGAESSCANCHYGAGAGAHPGALDVSLINKGTFIASAATSGGDGTPVPINTVFCASCHKPAAPGNPYPAPLHVAIALNPGITCTGCHTDPTGQGNGTGDAHKILALPSCVSCHAVGQKQVNATLVNDNNGVRQITGAGGEFQQWSHHIINDTNNSADPVDAQCVVCHVEGTIKSGAVSVTSTEHMNDGIIHLRDCNPALNQNQSTGTEFQWDPANPNHTAMDQFCMSCHNAAGAAGATVPRPTTALGAPKNATALNPFGDLIQNNFDGLSRNAVVAVYDQFDPSNTSHHAVRASRYTANSADTTAAQGNNMFPAGVTKVAAAAGTFANLSANNAAVGNKNLRYANGTSYVGTMADTGKFVTTYKALVNNNAATFAPLADNSQIHCGDCHTVGQWAARGSAAFQAYSTAYGAGVTAYYKTAIGAHGSGNEYMLRNHNGDNALNPIALVCYNCHASTLYGSGGASTATRIKLVISGVTPAGPANGGGIDPAASWKLYNYTSSSRLVPYTFNNIGGTLYNDPAANQRGNVTSTTATAHDGVAGTLGSVHCNDDENSTAGLTGLARLNTSNMTAVAFNGYTTGRMSNTGGGNAFGIKCANCHNSGDNTNPGYGGIHGNAFRPATPAADGSDVVHNASYTTYSSSTGAYPYSATNTVVTVSHKPYRFLPGLGNFRYNGGDFTLYGGQNVTSSLGCYTLNGAQAPGGFGGSIVVTYPTNGNHQANFTNNTINTTGKIANPQGDNGLLGTWGACAEHASGSSGNPESEPKRNVIRPLQY